MKKSILILLLFIISILLLSLGGDAIIRSLIQEPDTKKTQEINNMEVKQQRTYRYTSYVCNRVEHYQNGNFSLGENVRSNVTIKNSNIYVNLKKSVCITEMNFRIISAEEVDENRIIYYATGNYDERHTFYIDYKENIIRMENFHNGNNYSIIFKISRKS
jgi:hypothetical protein